MVSYLELLVKGEQRGRDAVYAQNFAVESFLEDEDFERQSIRRRVAGAFVNLGVKIDPEAAEDVVPADYVA